MKILVSVMLIKVSFSAPLEKVFFSSRRTSSPSFFERVEAFLLGRSRTDKSLASIHQLVERNMEKTTSW